MDLGSDKLLEFTASNEIRMLVRTSGTLADSTSSNTVTDADWHHILVTYDSTQADIFFDGVEVSYSAHPNGTGSETDDSDTSFHIAADGPLTSGLHFDGGMDDIRIYNRVLSQEDVTRLYNMGR